MKLTKENLYALSQVGRSDGQYSVLQLHTLDHELFILIFVHGISFDLSCDILVKIIDERTIQTETSKE